ncbi:MAG: caspase family protein [Verrucomicrobiales bacterium]|nr:caspase family protein [Verrucomicrobiales bacterium]
MRNFCFAFFLTFCACSLSLPAAPRIQPAIGHRAPVSSVLFLEKPGLLATASDDRSIIIWNCRSGEVLRRIGAPKKVMWLLQKPGTKILLAGVAERADGVEVVAFDYETGAPATAGAQITGPEVTTADTYQGRHRAMREARDPSERSMWDKFGPLVHDDTTAYALNQSEGLLALGFADGHAELWDVRTLHRLATLRTKTAVVHGVACSETGRHLATWEFAFGRAQTGASLDPDLRLWDLGLMQVHRVRLPDASGALSAVLTPDGDWLYVYLTDRKEGEHTFRLLEVDVKNAVVTREIANRPFSASLRMDATGRWLMLNEMTGEGKKAGVHVWDRTLPPARMVRVLEDDDQTRGAFLPDGKGLVVGRWMMPAVYAMSGKRTLGMDENQLLPAGGAPRPFRNLNQSENTGFMVDLDCSRDGKWIAYGSTHRGLGGFQVVNMQTATRWGGDVPGLHHTRFRPGYDQVIVAGSHGSKSVHLFDLATGRELSKWEESQGEADRAMYGAASGWTALKDALAVTADGNRLFLAMTDGSTRMLGLDAQGNMRNVLHLVTAGWDDWCAVLPDGHYSASPGGLNAMHVLEGERSLPLAQADASLNRPDLVAAAAGVEPGLVETLHQLWKKRVEKLGGGSDSRGSGSRPKVSVDAVSSWPVVQTDATFRVTIKAVSSRQMLAKMSVVVNGVPWPGSKGIPFAEAAREQTATLNIPLTGGENRLQISVIDSAGQESEREILQVTRSTRPLRGVVGVSVGISSYANSGFNLGLPDDDAAALAAAMSRQADDGAASQVVPVLNEKATRQQILAAGEVLKNSRPDDLAFLFVAGHGVMADVAGAPVYFFCPHDMDFDNPSEKGIRFEELAGLFDGIPARHRLLMLDTCHAGELDDSGFAVAQKAAAARGLVLQRGAPGGGVRSVADPGNLVLSDIFADFRSGTGAVVLGACGAAQTAAERGEWGHGAFTYALLDGINRGSADLNADGRVSCYEWHRFASSKVRELTGGFQRPASRGLNPDGDFSLLLTAPPESFDAAVMAVRILRGLSQVNGWAPDYADLALLLAERGDFGYGTETQEQFFARLRSQVGSYRQLSAVPSGKPVLASPSPERRTVTYPVAVTAWPNQAQAQAVINSGTAVFGMVWGGEGWRVETLHASWLGAAPAAMPPAVDPAGDDPAGVVIRFIRAGNSGSQESQLNFYAPQVAQYFDDANVDHAAIGKDIATYSARWPQRAYQIVGAPVVRTQGTRWLVTVDLSYQVSDGVKSRAGRARNEIELARQAGHLVITSIRAAGVQPPAPQPETSRSPEQLAAGPEAVLRQYLAASMDNSRTAEAASLFAAQADYFGSRFTRQQILADAQEYAASHPQRSFEIVGAVQPQAGMGGNEVAFTYTFRFVISGVKASSGSRRMLVRLRRDPEGWRIIYLNNAK